MADEEPKPEDAPEKGKAEAPPENEAGAPAATPPAITDTDSPPDNAGGEAEEAEQQQPAAKTAPAEDAKAEPPKAEKADPAKAEPAKAEQTKEERKASNRGASDAVFAELDPEGGEKPKILKAKGSKNVHHGVVHVLATFNNTIVTITDTQGNVIGWSSAGKMGFRGSRKSTAYAAQLVSQDACRQAMSHGLKEAEIRVKGPGSGRESAVRAVQAIGIDVSTIRDVTPVPHNGCRPPKPRRV